MPTYDWSRCIINFEEVPKGKRILDHFPELAAYPEFVNVMNDNEIKIAIALADEESPIRKIKEPQMRLMALFEFLDIGLKTVVMKEFFDQVLKYKHPSVMAACCRVIQMINNHEYATWWTLNVSFYELQQESVKPRDANTDVSKHVQAKVIITNQMDAIGKKLKDYEARLFGDIKMKQAMVDQELQKIRFFPEQMAEKFPGFNNELSES